MHLFAPHPLDNLDIGLIFSAIASLINFAVALLLLREGKKHRSIILEADGHHLMTDVDTSGPSSSPCAWSGRPAGCGSIRSSPSWWPFTSWPPACILMRRSFDGLMDHAWPAKELEQLGLTSASISNWAWLFTLYAPELPAPAV